jgi:hypothetical protein
MSHLQQLLILKQICIIDSFQCTFQNTDALKIKKFKPSNLEKPISQINNYSPVHLQSTYRDRDIRTEGNILAGEAIA